ncbi:hypothetical protein TNIN_53291, partial [Trichonephila inaurata madagascariensis]
ILVDSTLPFNDLDLNERSHQNGDCFLFLWSQNDTDASSIYALQ